jgi:Flp pilus assembly protein TadD
LKDFKPAIVSLERAVQLEPGNVEARINLGYAYSQTKRYPKLFPNSDQR